MTGSKRRKRSYFVPEVVQTSAMDCGPASLKALLEGYGIQVGYERLREACQTDVDGSSIDTMEDLARMLGLDAEQVMTPVDHILLPTTPKPAIVVVRQPNGFTHFVLLWRTHGRLVQLMDPATGRQWASAQRFIDHLYVHQMPVSAQAWRTYAGGEEFLGGLRILMKRGGLSPQIQEELIARGLNDAGWETLAALDAATRMVGSVIDAGGIASGRASGSLLRDLFDTTLREGVAESKTIPTDYWSVRPATPDDEGNEQVELRGAVMVRVNGVLSDDANAPTDATLQLPPDLARALDEPAIHPARRLLGFLRVDGLLTLLILVGSLLVAAAGVALEALLFRGLFDLGHRLAPPEHRLIAIGFFVLLIGLLLAVDLPIARALLRMGRRLEVRLRLAFMERIPLLGDRYFQSRPISDMAERSHSIQNIRLLPGFGGQFIRTLFQFLLTIVGIVWIDPAAAPMAAIGGGIVLALPLLFNPLLAERDLKARTHVGALSRFYLDALLGLVPIRTHGAESSVRREHESLLVEWARSSYSLQRGAVVLEGLQGIAGLGFAGWIIFDHVARVGADGGLLLLAWWALQLPTLGQTIGLLARQYPTLRNLTLRLLEPLGVTIADESALPPPTIKSEAPGVAIAMNDVRVVASGHTILEDININIEAGSHIAIVGHSGSGKSSSAGLLLGWMTPMEGEVRIDGVALDRDSLHQLRSETAWVDPSVQLWNRSFITNLTYGAEQTAMDLPQAIDAADLRGVLERLPDGLGTTLGEGGGLLSGGEGQRVRFGRALLRPRTRLVIFDEPFRGLDRERRRLLLQNARHIWREATFLCITHDVSDTLSFPRVILFDHGRIVEDDAPTLLAERGDSKFRALLDADDAVRHAAWSSQTWRRVRIQDGKVIAEVEP